MLPFYRRPITRKTVLIVLLTPIIVTGVPALLWLGWNARPLNFESEYSIKTPAVPVPNAHDLFLQADKKIISPMGKKKPVARIFDGKADEDESKDSQTYPLAAKKLWLQENPSGFRLLNQALEAEYYFPPVRSAQPNGEIPSPYHLRSLARYVAVECEVLAEEGHSDKAVNRAMDIWKMGLDGMRGAPLTVALYATSLEHIAHRSLTGEIGHLNGVQAKRAANRFEKLLATRTKYEAILREEWNVNFFQIKPIIESSIRDKERAIKIETAIENGKTYDYPDSDFGPAPEINGPFINWTVRQAAQKKAQKLELLFDNADTPWPRHQTALASDIEPETERWLRTLERSRFYFARAEAMGNIVLTRFALHAYRKDKSVFPPDLKTLVPQYLAKVPLDPFSDNVSLRYKIAGKRYKLWSIGPDARDDKARPALNPNPRRAKDRYLVSIDSTGDIVAQISR